MILAGLVAVVLGHWVEHLVQAWQIWVLGRPPARALGALGAAWPWLVHSEVLHWALNVVILTGLAGLRHGFHGAARTWWTAALMLQTWHFIEHCLLLGQYVTGRNVLGRLVPTSVLQLWVPRVNLHLAYNAVVTGPLVLGAILYFAGSGPRAIGPAARARRERQCNRRARSVSHKRIKLDLAATCCSARRRC